MLNTFIALKKSEIIIESNHQKRYNYVC